MGKTKIKMSQYHNVVWLGFMRILHPL